MFQFAFRLYNFLSGQKCWFWITDANELKDTWVACAFFLIKQNVCPHFFALNTNLSAASDGKFLKGPDVVNQQVHKPQLVTESN